MIDEFSKELVAIGKTLACHAFGRANGLSCLLRKREVHGTVFVAEETGGGECLELLLFADAFEALADVDEGRHNMVVRAQHASYPRAEVRARNSLGRDVASVPVILVARVKDASEIRLHRRANQGAAIHHAGDVLKAGADLDVINYRVDRGEGAEN